MNNYPKFHSQPIGQLNDYITSLNYNNQGNKWVATSASGELVISENGQDFTYLLENNGYALDIACFSAEDVYLAATGQAGKIYIWRWDNHQYEIIQELDYSPHWISCLQWHPKNNLLAFAAGKNVIIWNGQIHSVITTLPFNNSAVSSIAWSPDGEYLAVGGYQEVKVWHSQNWTESPRIILIETASNTIAWSPDGKYLASANLDYTISVIEWAGHPDPWLMRGLRGKTRYLVWTQSYSQTEPLLAVGCREQLIIWYRSMDDDTGWEGAVVGEHFGIIQGVKFHPDDRLLLSIGDDGLIKFWQDSQELIQTLIIDEKDGLVAIANHPHHQNLIIGTEQGQIRLISN